MANKRIIEQAASTTISNDDWLIKDSPTDGTTKIQASVFKTLMNDGMASDEDLADAIENIAGEYDSEVEYSKDALCFKDGVLYIANADTTGTWDSTKWDATTIADIIANLRIDANDVVDVKVKGDSLVNSSKIAVLDSLTAQGSASGNIASFSDGSTHQMSKLEVAIDPIQDLHGYDSPWVGGAGKNKLEVTTASRTIDGVTYTVSDEGIITANGTVTSTNPVTNLIFSNQTLPAGDYILNGCEDGSSATYRINVYAGSTRIAMQTSSDVPFTLEEETTLSIRLAANNGYSYNNVVIKPMIRLATVSDATFEPYSNICPISGFTEANVSVSGVNIYNGQWEVGGIRVADGTTVSASAVRSKEYIQVPMGEKLYFFIPATIYIYYYDLAKNYKGYISIANSAIVTPPQGTKYVKYQLTSTYGTTYNNDISINYPSTDTSYHAYNGQTYNIEFKDGSNPLTVYGGTLDVISGVLTVDRANVDLGDLNWLLRADLDNGNYRYYNTEISNVVKKPSSMSIMPNIECSHYKNKLPSQYNRAVDGITIYINGSIQVYDSTKNTLTTTDFKTAMNGVQLVYELATPITYQLTPTQVKSLLGTNNVWADTGDVNEAVYTRDLNTTVNDIISRIEALENA